MLFLIINRALIISKYLLGLPKNSKELLYLIVTLKRQNILRSNVLCHHFYLPKVILQVQNGNGVLNRLVSCFKCMELAC